MGTLAEVLSNPLGVVEWFVYLLAAVLFVVGLHMMNSPKTARKGNLISAAGMVMAVVMAFIVLFVTEIGNGFEHLVAVVLLIVGILIGTIVGVTNVIPVFGPFIGAVPSALIILLVEPLQAFYFIIFIIVLQQVDGNVIGPKILGNTVGISGFWVLISITVAAGIFGFAGMLLGVPVFAVIYLIISDVVNSSLRKKQKTTITDDYYDIHEVADLDRKAQAEEAPEETSPNNT